MVSHRVTVFIVAAILLVTGFTLISNSSKENKVQNTLLQDKIKEIELELKAKDNQLTALSSSAESNAASTASEIEIKEERYQRQIEELKLQLAKSSLSHDKFSGTELKNSYYLKKTIIRDLPEYERTIYTIPEFETTDNNLIILTSIGHSESYGPKRTFNDFYKLLVGLEFDKSKATLGLLVGSKEEYLIIEKYIENLTSEKSEQFSKIILIQSYFIEELYNFDRGSRHALNVQKERRRAISRSRNFLLSSALTDEYYTLCIDSDMIEIPKNVISIFENSQKDIVVPRIRKGLAENYDFNSWVGTRKSPTAEEDAQLDQDPNYVYVPMPDQAQHMHELFHSRENTGKLDYSVKLDSVGGAVLWAKSEIFKQGVNFPFYYVIGTKWNRFEGFDGIETEGVCYLAEKIGYKCWGMPNLIAWHVDEFGVDPEI
ncbi:hypothetical protein WICMUC_000585 [Wickerhamomyces mucosus]|uniref:Glycosyltransferase family 62 protein n=1 Tax=Wickerhamomyces mucosus TaxID=1378264 RepID=A0A9P8PYA2_9ASCO|nr:hypothetical protein WICMUC_000585 [Wickerhamomyces mucosus]